MIDYLECIILGIVGTGIELMFQRGLFPRMMLRKYMLFLMKLHFSGNKFLMYLAKPIGLCPYCHGFWIAIAIHWLFAGLYYDLVITMGIWYLSLLIALKFIPDVIWEIPSSKGVYILMKKKKEL